MEPGKDLRTRANLALHEEDYTTDCRKSSISKKYIEKAKAAGDKDAEARFSLPKLYAEGFSQEALEFNCETKRSAARCATFPAL